MAVSSNTLIFLGFPCSCPKGYADDKCILTGNKNIDYILLISMEVPESLMKKVKRIKHTLTGLHLAHHHSQAKCQLAQTSSLNKLNVSYLPYNKHLIN